MKILPANCWLLIQYHCLNYRTQAMIYVLSSDTPSAHPSWNYWMMLTNVRTKIQHKSIPIDSSFISEECLALCTACCSWGGHFCHHPSHLLSGLKIGRTYCCILVPHYTFSIDVQQLILSFCCEEMPCVKESITTLTAYLDHSFSRINIRSCQ